MIGDPTNARQAFRPIAFVTPGHLLTFAMRSFASGSIIAASLVSSACELHPTTVLSGLSAIAVVATATSGFCLSSYPDTTAPAGAVYTVFLCFCCLEVPPPPRTRDRSYLLNAFLVDCPPAHSPWILSLAWCMAAQGFGLSSFRVPQVCLGGYFATIGSVKARWVPESMRATVYNLFRVPLNLLVIGNELLSPSTSDTLFIGSLLLVIAFGCFLFARRIILRREGVPDNPKTEASGLIAPA